MRRKEFISKKLAVILMAATIVIAPITGIIAMPMNAFATPDVDILEQYKYMSGNFEWIDDNHQGEVDLVQESHTMRRVNEGDIDHNKGGVLHNTETGNVGYNEDRVYLNDGHVGTNDFTVMYNSPTGTVDENNYEVWDNDGYVDVNNHVVSNCSGVVGENRGLVMGMPSNYVMRYENKVDSVGTVNVNNGGIIMNGAWENDSITVNEFVSGEVVTDAMYTNRNGSEVVPRKGTVHIINNYDSEEFKDNNLVIVDNQYHTVTFDNLENATAQYDNFDKNYMGVNYEKTAANKEDIPLDGIITLKANDGYKIDDDGQLAGEVGKLAYSLAKNDDGSYTVNINSLNENVLLTPEMLHLIISKLTGDETPTEVQIGDTVINLDELKDDDVVVISGGSSSDNNGDSSAPTESSVPAGYNLSDEAIKAITDQVQKQVAANGNDIATLEVIDIYFGDKIDMTPDVIKYLCEKVPVAKRCHFDYKDQEHILFIPAFDLNAPAYAEGLETLAKEPAHTAGFLRIKDIFVKLGFATKVVEEEAAE